MLVLFKLFKMHRFKSYLISHGLHLSKLKSIFSLIPFMELQVTNASIFNSLIFNKKDDRIMVYLLFNTFIVDNLNS